MSTSQSHAIPHPSSTDDSNASAVPYSFVLADPSDPRLALNLGLTPPQLAFYRSGARYRFFVGGIGSGKTTAGAACAFAYAGLCHRSLGLVAAPTYTMLRDTTQRAFFELCPATAIRSFSKTHQRLTLRNGSEILFRSADQPDRLRGLNLAWFWLDEATLSGHYAWQILKGRLRQRGFPRFGLATGTPTGRDRFYEDFEHAPLPGHALIRASTRTNLANLPAGYLDELGYTGAFADQEIEGIFTAFEGLVYAFDASTRGHLRDPQPDAVWADVIGGIDWGYANPAAVVVFGLDGDGRAWQLDEFYQRRAPLESVLLPAILDLTRRHAVRHWYCGPDEPEHIAALSAALARAGLPARALRADHAVQPGIQTLTALLASREDGAPGLYVAPRCVHTIAEFGAYQYPTADPTRRDPSEQPLKHSDHALDAARYALHTHLSRARATDAYLANLIRRLPAPPSP